MNKITIMFASALLVSVFVMGCTPDSVKMAQNGSYASQAVSDGVHRDMFLALSRENFETAKLNILLNAEKLKAGKSAEEQSAIDKSTSDSIVALKEFAKKRDFMVEWDRDHERSLAYKYVTVDAKLFSSEGILNYIAGQFSDKTKSVFEAWDAAKGVWDVNKLKSTATQPAS